MTSAAVGNRRETFTPPRSYDFHGVGLAISGEAAPFDALAARLRSFERESTQPVRVDLSFQFDRVEHPSRHVIRRPSGPLRPVYEPQEGEVLYDARADILFLGYTERIRVLSDIASGHTQVSIVQPGLHDDWLLSHPILTLPLLEILKRRGLFGLHAAGVSRGGRGILLPGTSGSGKSTLALALARAGYEFLSDDMLFLDGRAVDSEVLAFPDEIDVTDTTAGFFPELRPLLDQRRRAGWPKRSFRMESVYALPPRRQCRPCAVVFPWIADTDRSRLEPMRAEEALIEMAPNVLLTQPQASQAHFAALARLANRTPCYRLWTGRDFDAIPALLGVLVA